MRSGPTLKKLSSVAGAFLHCFFSVLRRRSAPDAGAGGILIDFLDPAPFLHCFFSSFRRRSASGAGAGGNPIDFWSYLDGSGALGARLGSKENENLCGSVVFFCCCSDPGMQRKMKISGLGARFLR